MVSRFPFSSTKSHANFKELFTFQVRLQLLSSQQKLVRLATIITWQNRDIPGGCY